MMAIVFSASTHRIQDMVRGNTGAEPVERYRNSIQRGIEEFATREGPH